MKMSAEALQTFARNFCSAFPSILSTQYLFTGDCAFVSSVDVDASALRVLGVSGVRASCRKQSALAWWARHSADPRRLYVQREHARARRHVEMLHTKSSPAAATTSTSAAAADRGTVAASSGLRCLAQPLQANLPRSVQSTHSYSSCEILVNMLDDAGGGIT